MINKRLKANSLWVIIYGAVCLAYVMGCASTENQTTPNYIAPDENVLRVGVSTNAPPLIYKQGEKIVGLEAELAHELAKFLNKSVYFTEIKWEDQISALLDNQTDIIMSGMSITALREFRIAFSKPYFRSGQMALMHKKDTARFSAGFFAITAQYLRIGVVKGTTGEYFVRKSFHSAKKIETFSTAKDGVEALIKQKLDLFIHDAPIIMMLAAENESRAVLPLYSLLTEEYLAWGIRKDDTELLESANRFMTNIRGDGRLKKIVKRWIPLSE
jgi:polar amino acid transport system substrate-binding protein